MLVGANALADAEVTAIAKANAWQSRCLLSKNKIFMLLCPSMGADTVPTVMHSKGMAKPQIYRFVITFTLGDLQSDQYRRLGFQHEGSSLRVANDLSDGYQAGCGVVILTTKAGKAGAKGDSSRCGGQSVCDGTASLARARHH